LFLLYVLRSMEGEEVIGSSLFPLKQEILQLEKMEKTSSARVSHSNDNANTNNSNSELCFFYAH
jgi:hypothetical protein